MYSSTACHINVPLSSKRIFSGFKSLQHSNKYRPINQMIHNSQQYFCLRIDCIIVTVRAIKMSELLTSPVAEDSLSFRSHAITIKYKTTSRNTNVFNTKITCTQCSLHASVSIRTWFQPHRKQLVPPQSLDCPCCEYETSDRHRSSVSALDKARLSSQTHMLNSPNTTTKTILNCPLLLLLTFYYNYFLCPASTKPLTLNIAAKKRVNYWFATG